MTAGPAILPLKTVQPSTQVALGSQVARGVVWTLLFSAVTKLMTFGSQIALAWFLVPEEFGLVAMTLSIMNFTAVVGGGTLRNILIQRTDRFTEEAGQVFWLALALNAGAAVALALFSPLAGILFNEPRVVGLILVAALAPAIQSLSTIYLAALQRDLRFRQVAIVQCSASAVQNGSSVLLAWLGAGALALVLPLTFTAVWTAIAYRLSAGKIFIGHPRPKSWRALGLPAWWLMIHALFSALLASGACVVIGVIQSDPATIGFYYWGFSVSSQAVFLLVNNLQGVLFPTLSRLNADSDRQFTAVEKASRTLLFVITPISVLQWLLAAPLISGLFQSRWDPAIPVVEWISVGLLSQPLYLLTVSVLLAKGRYRKLAMTTAFVATVTVAAATAGAFVGDQAVIARYAGLALLASNLVAGWVTFHEFGRGWRQLLTMIAPVAVMAMFVGFLGWWTSHAASKESPWFQVTATTLSVLVSYGLLARIFLPEITSDIAVRLFKTRPLTGLEAAASEGSERFQP